MKDKIIKCSIHKGILENPVQCINCKQYCCKDCIDNYYNKYCPFCNNEKNYYPDIKLLTDLKSRFRKCENCEIYFERTHFEKHKIKCEKKIINCYFCNFVGTKEKFFEHFNKKHKKILINDFKDIFGNNNQNNNNYSDINNEFYLEESDDNNLYNYNKKKSNDYINIGHIHSIKNLNINNNINCFDNNIVKKNESSKSTKNKDGKKFIFETPINKNNSDNNNNNYNKNNYNINFNNINDDDIYNNININNINDNNNNNNDNDNKSYNVEDNGMKNTMILAENGYFYCNKPKDFKCNCCEDNICKLGNCMCGYCQKANCKNKYFERKCLINKYGKKSIFSLGKFVCYFDYGYGKKCDGINYVCPGCQSLLENRIHYLDEKTYREMQIIIDYNSN